MQIERLPSIRACALFATLITVAVLAVFEVLAWSLGGVPGPTPILALPIVVAGGMFGAVGGAVSSAIMIAYALLEGGLGPGIVFPHDDRFIARTVLAVPAFPALGLFVGWLRQFAEQRIHSERGARMAVEAGERRYRELVEGLDAVVWEATPPNYVVDFVSRRAVELFGYPLSDWLASSAIWKRLIHPDDYDRVMSSCDAAVRSLEGYQLEYRVVTQGGLVLWVRSFVDVVAALPDMPPRFRCVMVDVTDRRHAEMVARENEERVRSLLDHAADAVLVHDFDGRFVDVNQAACDILGYARDELLRLRVADIEADFDEARSRPTWLGLRQGERRQLDAVYKRKAGSPFPVELRIGLFEWSGRPLVVALARDTSERRRLEQQLRQSQKMEAVGRLAGGVAHDFNNLLTAIKGHAELILQDGATEHVRTDLEEITRAADRAAALTRKLLAFSRQQIFAPETLDLNAVVLETSRLLKPLIGEHIQFDTRLEQIGPIRADRGQIEQVLLNLVVNARDAMPDGGELTITTYNLDVDQTRPFRHPFVRTGRYVVLDVTDTGCGMDAETLARIFEPFFTTKEKGKGSGLGLATAYGIVKQSGGYLIAESEPGRGATFLVVLPRGDTPTRELAGRTDNASKANGRGEVVLIVEDEAPVRSLVGRVLGRHGYHIIEACDGKEALRRASEFDGTIDLLISDVMTPEIDGGELARRLTRDRPGTRVLLMSGYTGDLLDRVGDVPAGTSVLEKPFTPDQLSRRVRAILNGEG